ncbi:MAG: hypothetical protein WBK77_02810 [Alphaproteobacteria bacterium]
MGFCLLQEAVRDGFFLAVNSSHVEDIIPQKDSKRGEPACLLSFSFVVKEFRPLVLGSQDAIRSTLMQAAKVGLKKIQINTFIPQKGGARSIPLYLKNTDNVGLVREILPEDLPTIGIGSSVASEIYLYESPMKIIDCRPGAFAQHANDSGNVPVLKIR